MTYETLTDAETRDLHALAGLMIPASATHGVPGAGGDLSLADIVRGLGRVTAAAESALQQLVTLSGGAFSALTAERRGEVAARFKQEGGAPLFTLNRVVLLCYYRDDRVMRSLGQEPRSPFPKGHVVEQGDWSLLDPVRKRPPMWRRV